MTTARRLRLLLTTDAVGGVWVYSVELARALKPLGVEVLLAVMGPSPEEVQRRDAEGIRLIETGLPLDWTETNPAELARAGRVLAAIAAREGVDLVQTCSAVVLADAQFAQPTVAVQHSCVASWWAAVRGTPLPEDFEWRTELVAAGLRHATAVVAPSAVVHPTAQVGPFVVIAHRIQPGAARDAVTAQLRDTDLAVRPHRRVLLVRSETSPEAASRRSSPSSP